MADYLNADPAALYQASGEVRRGRHPDRCPAAPATESENAQHGWVGGSSQLTGLLEHWSAVQTHRAKKFSHHATGLHNTATCFDQMTHNHVHAIDAAYPPSARDL